MFNLKAVKFSSCSFFIQNVIVYQVLSDRLLARQEEFRLERQRQVREEQKRTKKAKNKKAENKALNEAKRRAQEILNLSAYDIEDFLNSDTDSEDEQVGL